MKRFPKSALAMYDIELTPCLGILSLHPSPLTALSVFTCALKIPRAHIFDSTYSIHIICVRLSPRLRVCSFSREEYGVTNTEHSVWQGSRWPVNAC